MESLAQGPNGAPAARSTAFAEIPTITATQGVKLRLGLAVR
jgi:hypothetical protein